MKMRKKPYIKAMKAKPCSPTFQLYTDPITKGTASNDAHINPQAKLF